MKNLQFTFDKSAIGISALCLAHCLLIPLATTVLPVAVALPLEDEGFHKLLLFAVLPTSLIALTLGCRKHRSWNVFWSGAIGLFILIFTAVLGHELISEWGEKIATVIGSGFIIFSHIKNYKLCGMNHCDC